MFWFKIRFGSGKQVICRDVSTCKEAIAEGEIFHHAHEFGRIDKIAAACSVTGWIANFLFMKVCKDCTCRTGLSTPSKWTAATWKMVIYTRPSWEGNCLI